MASLVFAEYLREVLIVAFMLIVTTNHDTITNRMTNFLIAQPITIPITMLIFVSRD